MRTERTGPHALIFIEADRALPGDFDVLVQDLLAKAASHDEHATREALKASVPTTVSPTPPVMTMSKQALRAAMESIKTSGAPWGTMKRTFTVVMERDVDGGFIASVPELPGCHSQGDSIEELRKNILEAVHLYLQDEDIGDLPEFVGLERIEVSG